MGNGLLSHSGAKASKEETIGDVELDQAVLGPVSQGQKPKAPGMKYRHYAPRAELILVEEEGTVSDKVITIIKELTEEKSTSRIISIFPFISWYTWHSGPGH